MDEGQCFRCGRVPRLCECPEGVLESPPPPKVYSECPRRFKYGLLKDGQYVEQESEAIKTGTEIHEAIETLLRHGLVLVQPELPRDRQALIDSLTFEPFVFEEEPNNSEYERSYKRPTQETRGRVRAGAVLKLKDGYLYFVGECNELLGVCDDCCEFKHEDIVEIAYLWEEELEVSKSDTWEDKLRAELAARENEETA
jgi:hypothetical protein